jgi:hypothetical protein
MFDLDLPFPQAISTCADCCEAIAAGTFLYVIHFGRRHCDCCAIAIFLAGVIPLNATPLLCAIPSNTAPLLFFEPLLFFQLAQ